MGDSTTSRESIRRVKKKVEHDLLGLPNVHAIDIGEKIKDDQPTGELSIVVYVDKKKNVAAKNTIPKEFDGVKTDVQEQEPDVLHPAQLLVDEDELLLDTSRYTTLEGGMSIGPCRSIFMEPPDVSVAGNYVFVGTLGAIVTDRSSGDPMMLTNFHVACVDDSWSVGDDMAQPSRVDGGSCPGDTVGELERAVLGGTVDGAVLSISGRPHVCEILEIGDVRGSKAATVGMDVRKRGRTTDLTFGEVISTDYTTTINYGDGLGSVTLTDQIRISVDTLQSTQFGTNGDSGSVVVDDDGYVVGLYFAGNGAGTLGVANPIADVLDDLDVDICAAPKLLKEHPKEFTKEFAKEFAKDHFEGVFKEHHKELIKEWKEWAYEKYDWENWGRPPTVSQPPIVQPPVERPPVSRPPVARPPIRDRGTGVQRPMAGAGWVEDLSAYPIGAVPNPAALTHMSATVVQWNGVLAPAAEFEDWGAAHGLNVAYTTTLILCSDCTKVAVTLAHFSSPATVFAYDLSGNLLDSQTMTVHAAPETLVLNGGRRGIRRIIIDAPQDETILIAVECGGEEPPKPREEKCWDFEKPREKPPVFEKGQEKAWRESGPPNQPFIGRDLRPDLRRGALRGEPYQQ